MVLFVVLIDYNDVVESKKPTKVGCPCRMRHYESFRPLTVVLIELVRFCNFLK